MVSRARAAIYLLLIIATAQPLTGATLSDVTLQFELAGCRFAADVPDLASSVAGTVVCTVDAAAGLTARGRWTMSRQ